VKLAVSNIAWDIEEQAAVLEMLRRRDVRGIELAPTKLWPGWAGADVQSAANWRRAFASEQFELPSMQAIFFGRPELLILAPDPIRQEALEHIGRVANLASAFGSRALVFGAPRNRDLGHLTATEAAARAIDFFREAARICAAHGACLCLEPLPEAYGSKFMTRWRETRELVRAVDEPGFGLMLDTGCIHLAGDDPAEAVIVCNDMIRHFHVSEPHLSGFDRTVIDHARIGEALRQIDYSGWVSIEMRRPAAPLAQISEAVRRVSAWYGPF